MHACCGSGHGTCRHRHTCVHAAVVAMELVIVVVVAHACCGGGLWHSSLSSHVHACVHCMVVVTPQVVGVGVVHAMGRLAAALAAYMSLSLSLSQLWW